MRIVIDKALNHYMLYGSLILYGNIFLSLVLKKNKICNFFRYKHIVEIPTNKGANSYKLKILKKNGELASFHRLLLKGLHYSYIWYLHTSPLIRVLCCVEETETKLNTLLG